MYEYSRGNNATAASLLEQFYYFHEAMGLSSLTTAPAEDDSFEINDADISREWEMTCCITWEFFYLDA